MTFPNGVGKGFIFFILAAALFFLRCASKEPYTDYDVDGESLSGGAIIGMFEIEVLTWGDRFSGIHTDGIKLYLVNTLTNEKRTTETVNGFYYFDNLRKGNYRIYRATLLKENLNLELDLSMYTVVVDSYFTVMKRVKHFQAIRIRSFNEKGLNNKRVLINYPLNQPQKFIKSTFADRKEINYRLMVF